MSLYKADYFFEMFRSIISHVNIKIFGSIIFIVLSFLFDAALKDAMIAIFILCLFDFVTAVEAVRRTPNEKILSSGVWKTAAKLGIYFLLISAGHISETATSNVIPILDETIIGFLAVTELLSILENASKMGYAVPRKLIEKLSKYRDDK